MAEWYAERVHPLHNISTTNSFYDGVTVFLSQYRGSVFQHNLTGFGVPRSIYVETSFSTTRIIYGVTDINSSPKRPYLAFKQAADTEVSLSSFWIIARRQCCFSAVLIPRFVAHSLLWGLGGLVCGLSLTGKTRRSSESQLFSCQGTREFLPLTLYSTLFLKSITWKLKIFSYLFKNRYFAFVYHRLRHAVLSG